MGLFGACNCNRGSVSNAKGGHLDYAHVSVATWINARNISSKSSCLLCCGTFREFCRDLSQVGCVFFCLRATLELSVCAQAGLRKPLLCMCFQPRISAQMDNSQEVGFLRIVGMCTKLGLGIIDVSVFPVSMFCTYRLFTGRLFLENKGTLI